MAKQKLWRISVLAEHTSEQRNVKLFHYSTPGKSRTLNQLVREAQFNYIGLLDVDDLWAPHKLREQIKYCKEYDVVGSQCRYFGELTSKPKIKTGVLKVTDFLKENPIINSSCLIKREFCFWDESYDLLEDYEMWLRLLAKGCRFYNLNQALCKHRVHHNSFFNTDDRQEQIKEELIKRYQKKFKELNLIKPNSLKAKFIDWLLH